MKPVAKPLLIVTALKPLAAHAVSVLLIAHLAGCYLPVRFDAEIEITRFGTYNMIFDGYLVDVQFYDALRKGKMTPEEEERKIELLMKDMTRDSSVRKFHYLEKGHFKVHYEFQGAL